MKQANKPSMPSPEEPKSVKSKGKQPQEPCPDCELGAQQMSNPSTVRRRDKVLAACAGGCLTSLMMTPLDVVKTRVQTQSRLPSSSLLDRQSCWCTRQFPQLLSQTSCHLGGQSSLFSSARSHTLNPSITCSNPSICLSLNESSRITHLLHHPSSQPQPSPKFQAHSSGVTTTLVQIVKNEGIGSLWRGIAPGLLISIPAQAIYMLGYDTLRSAFLNLSPPDHPLESNVRLFYEATLTPLMSGVISRSFIAILFSPLELVRTRLQSTPSVVLPNLQTFDSNRKSSPSNAIRSSRQILQATLSSVRSSGLRSLYTGLPATLWRDVPFSGIYWSSYEFTKKILSGGRGFGEVGDHSTVQQLATQSFLAGSLSGAVAATFTNGFDVIKTRRQAKVSNQKSFGTMALLFQIARQEGLRNGLMRGLSLRLAKIMPSCGIMIASYEGLAHVFHKY